MTAAGALGALSLSLAACGGGGAAKPKPLTGANVAAATAAAQRYVDAYHARDATKICALVAASVQAQLGGAKCVKTVEASYKGATFPKLRAKRSFANSGTAIVTFQGTLRQVTVTRQGHSWKVIDGGT